MGTPDITKAQIIAVVQAVVALALAFGLDLTTQQQSAITTLSTVLAAALCGSDAAIRHGRSRSKNGS